MFRKFGLMFFLLATVGCNAFNPIAPIIQLGVMWSEGEAHKYYNTDQETVHNAVVTVLKDLEFPVVEDTHKGDYIYVVADTGDRFKIKIKEVRHNITKLSIRVNTFGDRPYAELIYRHVDREQGVKDFVTVKELNTAMESRKRIFPNLGKNVK